MDTKEKRATSRYVTAILDPSTTGISIEDLASNRGDGLCVASRLGPDPLIPLSAKELDPRSVDIDSICRWLTECDSMHSLACKPQASHNLNHIRLIDVESRCIVNYSSETRIYLALSYVWGKGRQNVAGAGLPGTKLGILPPTIEDALAFTRDLDKRYLWVDLVCIEQNNENDKLKQMGIMSDIFQGAYATIVAFDGTRLLGLGPALYQLNWVLPWSKRGWTYQEAILSPRCIFISKFHVYMECNALTYCETLDSRQSPVHLSPHDKDSFKKDTVLRKINTGVLRSPFSANIDLENGALHLYGLYVAIYSIRDLTKQSDALYAFSGILQALEKTAYKKGFSWALPNEDLNWALLWKPENGQRRNERFPTWSWLSWQGQVYVGQPTEDRPEDTHRWLFDLTIWKAGNSATEKIFEQRYSDMDVAEKRTLLDDPLAETNIPSEEGEKDDALAHLWNMEHAVKSQTLCIESYLFRFSPAVWEEIVKARTKRFRYFKTLIEDVWIYFVVLSSSDLSTTQGRNKGEAQFLLLARFLHPEEDGNGLVDHYLLMIESNAAGVFERSCVVLMEVPKEDLWVLEELGLVRTKILLA
ncbi:uncharacterized protein KY384_007971 [Bacidia gigantensis]|uniref:uncharacterized protein n=1 Tax=Bacidia gigantensis TaxID=2732470 RepID=UPI001D0445F7|nr:uncharacterized protein KY384_007971 [Bacidia gigantensis]KAG8527817.1 hypothetical protein KY384_007971 [Bacidia gigantensis]